MIVWAYNMSSLHNLEQYVRQHGVSLTGYKPATFDSKGNLKTYGYFYFNSPDIYTEVWGYPRMSAQRFSPPELVNLSMYTKCRVNNHWINAVHFSWFVCTQSLWSRRVETQPKLAASWWHGN